MPIAPKIVWSTVTADGVYDIGTKRNGRGTALLLVSGAFGGGTITGGYRDDGATFAITASGISGAGVVEIPCGTGMVLAFELTSSTAASIKIGVVMDDIDPVAV